MFGEEIYGKISIEAGEIRQYKERAMTTLTLNPKYVNILQTFGNIEEIVEEILYRYTLERINERIEKASQAVLGFEAKYGMPYREFYERAMNDDEFVAALWEADPTWEDDLMVWEYYGEVLSDWTNRLNNLLQD